MADLEGKLRELGERHGISNEPAMVIFREAAALGRAEGLEEAAKLNWLPICKKLSAILANGGWDIHPITLEIWIEMQAAKAIRALKEKV